ncbi:5-methyltetrahydropteroyltriglutamate--homocysteine methyltransferase [Streptomyces hainanensis]|uniref:5-methyltetrahydropteroyltriglutamate--homocysteine methyltransferase n=1 Tax=Streptomyces hainanensis TaxID=402648 RepID=A0A4R4TGY5_9ACTN|nr:5-methyltetrahydropteroyltriglutamate--homocysteine methyltransferase [Streptomyces hainanensis]TDC76807.1 5-methyltetrahydropteroyltriglutamate--homocysteine methyltransferase [Streptomyces hainanensis]
MNIPSEPIGSLPRTVDVLNAMAGGDGAALDEAVDQAVRETIDSLQDLGSTVVTDGEQAKASFWTYPVDGADGLAPDGVVIPYADGHQRQLPRLTAGPFRYRTRADQYLRTALRHAKVPVKQAVVAPSALSLLYPPQGIDGYPREAFLDDLLTESEQEIRGCLDAGAHSVQLDVEEARLALKLDPSGGVLRDFVELDNRLLERFGEAERARIGVHTSPGGDQDSTHSLDVDYAELLPELFRLQAGNFYLALAGEADQDRVLRITAEQLRPGVRVFVGVTDPLDPRVETADEVRDRVLRAARHIPPGQLGTCDDTGFSPFADDRSTSRQTAFAKIRARVEGTAKAAAELGG